MNKKNISFVICVLFLAMLACVSSSTTPAATEAPAQPPTLVPVIPSSTSAPIASSTAAIPHVDVPGELPAERSSYAADQDSFITSAEKR